MTLGASALLGAETGAFYRMSSRSRTALDECLEHGACQFHPAQSRDHQDGERLRTHIRGASAIRDQAKARLALLFPPLLQGDSTQPLEPISNPGTTLCTKDTSSEATAPPRDSKGDSKHERRHTWGTSNRRKPRRRFVKYFARSNPIRVTARIRLRSPPPPVSCLRRLRSSMIAACSCGLPSALECWLDHLRSCFGCRELDHLALLRHIAQQCA